MSDMTTAEREHLAKTQDELEAVCTRVAGTHFHGLVRAVAHLHAYILERDDGQSPRVRCSVCDHIEHRVWLSRRCRRWMWQGDSPNTRCDGDYAEIQVTPVLSEHE